ncbi:hypothetical protein PGB90_002511 [Kerria lacca]
MALSSTTKWTLQSLFSIFFKDLKTKLEENNFPNASKEPLKKKIKSLRQTFKQEDQKIEDSMKSGVSGDIIYEPKLASFSAAEYLCSGNINADS